MRRTVAERAYNKDVMSEVIRQAIEDAASKPKDATSGAHRVVQHSLRDLIAADEHINEQETAQRRTLPVRLFKIRPGGAV